MESTWSQRGVNLESTWGQRNVNTESIHNTHYTVNAESVQVNAESRLSQSRVNTMSTQSQSGVKGESRRVLEAESAVMESTVLDLT